MRIFVLIVGFLLGLAMVVYRERVKRFTGEFAFAERWFGPGGTYTFFLILGLLISLFSLMYGLGTLDAFFIKIFGPFFPEFGSPG